jgi:hypothetical protein
VLAATGIAGIAGYAVTFIIFRGVGSAEYALFAVFWGAMYLVVGGLSGIQQEIARATRPVDPSMQSRSRRARNFAVVATAVVAVLVAVIGFTSADTVFSARGPELVAPLAIAAGSYVVVAVLSGSLYGVGQWGSLAAMIAADGILRLGLAVIGVLISADIVVLAWMVALPFPLATMLLWPSIRRRFVGTSDIDVGYQQLTWNVARTILAASSTAVLVSGFPLVIGIAGAERPAAEVGQIIFVLTLVRAPLVVSVMSLQSYLVVRFRDAPSLGRLFFVATGSIVAATLILLLGAVIAGQPVIDVVSGEVSVIPAESLAIFVLSSGLVALLTVTGAALLGRSRHRAYSLGWLAAAMVSVTAILSIPDFSVALFVSVIAGPAAGLAAHVLALAIPDRPTTEALS